MIFTAFLLTGQFTSINPSQPKTAADNMPCGVSCIKYLVFVFNLLFAVSVAAIPSDVV